MLHASHRIQDEPIQAISILNVRLHRRLCLLVGHFSPELVVAAPGNLLNAPVLYGLGLNTAVIHDMSQGTELLVPQNLRGSVAILAVDGVVSVLTHARGKCESTDLMPAEGLLALQSYANMPTRTIIRCVEPSTLILLGCSPDRFVGM